MTSWERCWWREDQGGSWCTRGCSISTTSEKLQVHAAQLEQGRAEDDSSAGAKREEDDTDLLLQGSTGGAPPPPSICSATLLSLWELVHCMLDSWVLAQAPSFSHSSPSAHLPIPLVSRSPSQYVTVVSVPGCHSQHQPCLGHPYGLRQVPFDQWRGHPYALTSWTALLLRQWLGDATKMWHPTSTSRCPDLEHQDQMHTCCHRFSFLPPISSRLKLGFGRETPHMAAWARIWRRQPLICVVWPWIWWRRLPLELFLHCMLLLDTTPVADLCQCIFSSA
jgi:hypothetical protein